MLTDDELRRFRSGDSGFFEALVARLGPILYRRILPRVPDVDMAEEIIQDTWCKVYDARAQFRNAGLLDGWVWTICRNSWLRSIREQQSLGVAGQSETVMDDIPASAGETEAFCDADQAQSLGDRIDDLIMGLPPLQRRVAALRWLLKCSTRDTAQTLGLSQGTVRASLFQARSKMRASLKAGDIGTAFMSRPAEHDQTPLREAVPNKPKAGRVI